MRTKGELPLLHVFLVRNAPLNRGREDEETYQTDVQTALLKYSFFMFVVFGQKNKKGMNADHNFVVMLVEVLHAQTPYLEYKSGRVFITP